LAKIGIIIIQIQEFLEGFFIYCAVPRDGQEYNARIPGGLVSK